MKNAMQFVMSYKKTGTEAAFLAYPAGVAVTSWLGFQGAGSYETAAANIFRANDVQPNAVDNYCLFLTYPPTEMCMGLAWRAHVKRVYWVTHQGIKFRQAYPHPYPEVHTAVRNPNDLSGDINDFIGNWLKPIIIDKGNYKSSGPLVTKLNTGLRNNVSIINATSQTLQDKAYMKVVSGLVGSAWNDKVKKELRSGVNGRRPFGNNIGGVLVDGANKRILGWGLNMKHLNKCYHGETLMLLHYLRTHNTNKIPDGSSLYTSLEPCHMCSGFITTVGKNIRVISGQPDEGACDRSALRRGVNGCSLLGHNMPDPIRLEQMRGNSGMITFLFGQDSRQHFKGNTGTSSRNLVDSGLKRITDTHPHELPFLQEGVDLLEALRRAGIIRGETYSGKESGYYGRFQGPVIDKKDLDNYSGLL